MHIEDKLEDERRHVMRVLAALILVLAILIAVLPQFNNCFYEGMTLTTTNGKQVPMKCYWTARSEVTLAIPLAGVGIMLALSRRRGAGRALAILGGILGAMVILLPTALIGTCSMMQSSCSLVMKPALILMGTLVIVLSGIGLALAGRMPEQDA